MPLPASLLLWGSDVGTHTGRSWLDLKELKGGMDHSRLPEGGVLVVSGKG